MACNIDVIHLKKEELQYELRFRGVDPDDMSVDAMRSSLRSLRKLEKANESIHYPEYEFNAKVDYPQILATYTDLEKLVNEFNETRASANYRRICSRLYHLLGRIDTIPIVKVPVTETEHNRSSWVVKLTLLLDRLEEAAINNEGLQAEAKPASAVEEGHGISAVEMSTPVRPAKVDTLTCDDARKCTQPVHKWNLKFRGDSSGLSVVSFLERVEELRVARRVSKKELLESAIDLFEGKALLWYRSNGSRCHSWEEFTGLLKQHFLPPDYRARLFEEILRRTQGMDEPIVEYLACLKSMFRRHEGISDEVQLDIATRNLAPFYTMQLPVVNTIEELEIECLKLEVKKFRTDHYRAPCGSSSCSVEPELNYSRDGEIERKVSREPVIREVAVERENRVCWRCEKAGHLARNCRERVGIKCFGCGKQGFTKNSCPQCSKQNTLSGNGYRRQ